MCWFVLGKNTTYFLGIEGKMFLNLSKNGTFTSDSTQICQIGFNKFYIRCKNGCFLKKNLNFIKMKNIFKVSFCWVLLVTACASHTKKQSLDFHHLVEINIPLGASIFSNPNFFPDKWEEAAFLSVEGKDLATNVLDSTMYESASFLTRFYSTLHSNNRIYSGINLKQIQSESILPHAVSDVFLSDNKENNIYYYGYSILNNDTILYLSSNVLYTYEEVDETVNHLNYVIISTVKNAKLNDFLLLSFELLRPYQSPTRFFYISNNQQICLVDFDLGETNAKLGYSKWSIKNGFFVKINND